MQLDTYRIWSNRNERKRISCFQASGAALYRDRLIFAIEHLQSVCRPGARRAATFGTWLMDDDQRRLATQCDVTAWTPVYWTAATGRTWQRLDDNAVWSTGVGVRAANQRRPIPKIQFSPPTSRRWCNGRHCVEEIAGIYQLLVEKWRHRVRDVID